MFVKDQLKKALKKYDGLIVTEENLKSVKEDKKSLAALKAKINRFRIDEKKILLVPITEMEQNLKNLEAEIDSVLDPIKEGIKVYDDKKKQVNYEKRLEWLKKAYEKNELREEFQTIVVAHNTKKADIDAAVEAKLLVQLEKDNTDKANEQARQNDINWIKTSVKQQEDEKGIKLDENKYLNKYELNVPIQSIMSDIISDAQTNANNAAAAVVKKEKEVIEEVEVDVTKKVFDREAFNKFSEELESDNEPENNKIIEVPHTDGDQLEEPLVVPQKYKFVIEITETLENLQMLKEFFELTKMDYDQVGEVEEIKEES